MARDNYNIIITTIAVAIREYIIIATIEPTKSPCAQLPDHHHCLSIWLISAWTSSLNVCYGCYTTGSAMRKETTWDIFSFSNNF